MGETKQATEPSTMLAHEQTHEQATPKRRRIFCSAPSISDLRAHSEVLGTRAEVIACLKIQVCAQRWRQRRLTQKDEGEMHDEDDQISECAICCELLCEPVRWPRCDHAFCWPCMRQWGIHQKEPTCPMCRESEEAARSSYESEQAARMMSLPVIAGYPEV